MGSGLLLATYLLCFLPSSGRAQIVQGRLTDPTMQGPVEGALVLLLTEAGDEVGGYLTNQAGRFIIEAPSPGTYILRSERIGYETTESEPFRLEEGQRLGMELETAQRAIELAGIEVEGDQLCVVRPGEGLQLSNVWEEARKALTVQDWAERGGLFRFQITRYERQLDLTGRPLEGGTRAVESGVSGSPIQSLPVEDLLSQGFVRRADDGGYEYYGADASVLLSDAFLDSHCFRLTVDEDRAGQVGLAFEPVTLTGVPDIEGVLWLDAGTAELRTLEYAFTWTPWEAARGAARGFTRFEALESGAWVVRDWWIRMPRVELDISHSAAQRNDGVRLRGLKEVGGSISRVTPVFEAAGGDSRRGILEGVVWDSTRNQALPGATVFLSGTQYSTTTDQGGTYVIGDLPEGTFSLAFTHPRLDSLGVFPRGVEVGIQAGLITEARLAIPAVLGPGPVICSESDLAVHPGVITGVVMDAASGSPAHGATIRATWSSFEDRGTGNFVERRHSMQARADESGRYSLCGAPIGKTMTLVATLAGRQTEAVQVHANPDGHTVVHLAFEGSR